MPEAASALRVLGIPVDDGALPFFSSALPGQERQPQPVCPLLQKNGLGIPRLNLHLLSGQLVRRNRSRDRSGKLVNSVSSAGLKSPDEMCHADGSWARRAGNRAFDNG
jgi:hypothetical protein